jgi:peroxiredoxin
MADPLSLTGATLPDVALPATNGATVALSALRGMTVIYAYPRTSPPGAAPIEGWDLIPGARGCTPQACAFRDHFADLQAAGADAVYGLSTQDTAFQQEAAARLHLPFPLLSDDQGQLADFLPMFEAGGMHLFKRVALILQDDKIAHAMHPIPDPAANASEVIAWLRAHSAT